MSTEATVLDLVRTLAAPRLGGGSAPPASLSQLAMAKDYIDRHLTDPGLSAGRVAEAIGVSARHLSRIFQPTGVSPSRHLTIAEVAHHWGFASQAHFLPDDQHGDRHLSRWTRPPCGHPLGVSAAFCHDP